MVKELKENNAYNPHVQEQKCRKFLFFLLKAFIFLTTVYFSVVLMLLFLFDPIVVIGLIFGIYKVNVFISMYF